MYYQEDMDETSMHITKWKKPDSEKAAHWMTPTVWHFGKGKTAETVTGCKAARDRGWEGWIGRAQGIFRAVKLLCMIL